MKYIPPYETEDLEQWRKNKMLDTIFEGLKFYGRPTTFYLGEYKGYRDGAEWENHKYSDNKEFVKSLARRIDDWFFEKDLSFEVVSLGHATWYRRPYIKVGHRKHKWPKKVKWDF
jgi:hypothetical protein